MESLTPPLTMHERRILGYVIEGRTESQIAEAGASGDSQPDADIPGVIARVTQALLPRGKAAWQAWHRPGRPGTGRHRRSH